jgi:hypothetical protein
MAGWVCRGMGVPLTIVSDRDTRFMGKTFWKNMMETLKVKHNVTTARHQSANGQAEAGVKIAKRILKKMKIEHGNRKPWSKLVPYVEFAINNSVATATGFSPLFMAFGHNPRILPEDGLEEMTKDFAEFLKDIKLTVIQAQLEIQESHEEQIRYYNKKSMKAPILKQGDLVLVYGEGIAWPSNGKRKQDQANFIGPMKVLSGPNEDTGLNYTLELPSSLTRLKSNVFHVSKLRRYFKPDTWFIGRIDQNQNFALKETFM